MIEENGMINDNGKLAQTFNKYFVNIVSNLGISSFLENNDDLNKDDIDNPIIKFESYKSMIKRTKVSIDLSVFYQKFQQYMRGTCKSNLMSTSKIYFQNISVVLGRFRQIYGSENLLLAIIEKLEMRKVSLLQCYEKSFTMYLIIYL